jgi:hypothetical protein
MVGGCTVASGYKGYWVAGHPAAVAAGTLEVLLKVRKNMLGDEMEVWLVVTGTWLLPSGKSTVGP